MIGANPRDAQLTRMPEQTPEQLQRWADDHVKYWEQEAQKRIATAPTHALLAEGYPALSSAQLARLGNWGVHFSQTEIEI